jgi:hypothetical protein
MFEYAVKNSSKEKMLSSGLVGFNKGKSAMQFTRKIKRECG